MGYWALYFWSALLGATMGTVTGIGIVSLIPGEQGTLVCILLGAVLSFAFTQMVYWIFVSENY